MSRPCCRPFLAPRTLPAVCVLLAAAAAATSAAAQAPAEPRTSAAAPGAAAPAAIPPNRYGEAAPRARPDGTIRIASFNVLNLFDESDDPGLDGEWDDLPNATSRERCRNLAAAIRSVDADIIALQEVESLAALTWFRDTFLADAGYAFMASEDVGYYRGVECSLLSRFPVTRTEVWPNQSLADVDVSGPGFAEPPAGEDAGALTYQRSPLRVDVQVAEDYALTLFVLHHKAGRAFGWRREREAVRTLEKVEALQQRDPKRNVIVLGDFNAAPWDKSFRVYLEAGLVDPLGHRLIPRASWSDQSAAEQAESPRTKTHESGRVIDYVLLNAAAYAEYVPRSAHVVGPPFDPEYDWRNDPYPAWYASDHHPVVVDLVPRDAG